MTSNKMVAVLVQHTAVLFLQISEILTKFFQDKETTVKTMDRAQSKEEGTNMVGLKKYVLDDIEAPESNLPSDSSKLLPATLDPVIMPVGQNEPALSGDLPAIEATTKQTAPATYDTTDDDDLNQETTVTARMRNKIGQQAEDLPKPEIAKIESKVIVGIGTSEDLGRMFDPKYPEYYKRSEQGMILKDYEAQHKVIDEQYKEGEHYEKDPKEPIGRGGFGVVWRCRDINTKSIFCVKEIKEEYLSSEILIWVKLQNHDGFCKLHGAIKIVGNGKLKKVLILMENGGETLRKVLLNQKHCEKQGCLPTRFPLNLALNYFRQLLSALDFLEKKGIVHMDIKSNNILILVDETTTTLKVIDFGNSFEEPDDIDSDRHDYFDVVCATWVFREMLTGYEIKDPSHLGSSGMGGDEPFYVPHSLDLPDDVKKIFERGWQKDPDRKKCLAGTLLTMVLKTIEDMDAPNENNPIREESQPHQLTNRPSTLTQLQTILRRKYRSFLDLF